MPSVLGESADTNGRASSAPSRRPSPLVLSSAQIDALLRAVRDSVCRAQDSQRADDADVASVEVASAAACRLGEIDPTRLRGSGDIVAGVAGRIAGPFPASALLALEPADALAWVRACAPAADELEAFVALASKLLDAFAQALGEGTRFVGGRLDECPAAASLLATHAPGDTAVLAFELKLSIADRTLPASVYLMFDPKGLGQVTSAA